MLKTDFNNAIRNTNVPHKSIKEAFLFRKLLKCIKGNNGIGYECHGPKGMVTFDIPGSSNNPHQCEISDLLLIFVSNNVIRFTFMQNKYSRKKSDDLNITRMNSVQHYLLSERPVLLTSTLNIPLNILQNALLPGVGSYGNFSYDATTNEFDMVYFTAKTLKKKTSGVPKYTPKSNYTYFNSMTDPDWHCCINNVDECVHCTDLDVFEQKYKQMKIGTPIYLFGQSEEKDIETIKFLFNVINYCLHNENEVFDYRQVLEDIVDDLRESYNIQYDESFEANYNVVIKYIDDEYIL